MTDYAQCYVGYQTAGQVGVVNVKDNATLNVVKFDFGIQGNAYYNQSGGTCTANGAGFLFGYSANANETAAGTISGGLLQTPTFVLDK